MTAKLTQTLSNNKETRHGLTYKYYSQPMRSARSQDIGNHKVNCASTLATHNIE